MLQTRDLLDVRSMYGKCELFLLTLITPARRRPRMPYISRSSNVESVISAACARLLITLITVTGSAQRRNIALKVSQPSNDI